MIVVAVVAILAAVALPAYTDYRIRANEGSCLQETKSYANAALAAHYSNTTIAAPLVEACSAIDTFVDRSTPSRARHGCPLPGSHAVKWKAPPAR